MWIFSDIWHWLGARYADLIDGSYWFLGELWQFASGNALGLTFEGSTQTALKEVAFYSSISAALGLCFFIVCCVMFLPFQKNTAQTGLHEKRRPRVSAFTIVVTAPFWEEMAFRVFPLAVLTLVFPSAFAFYVFFLVFNAAWAVLHRWKWQKIILFLPIQARGIARPRWLVIIIFLDGFVFAYTLAKYGIFMSIVSHAVYNATILATSIALVIAVILLYLVLLSVRAILRYFAN